jgi:branched-chain amino acid transport system permease protein
MIAEFQRRAPWAGTALLLVVAIVALTAVVDAYKNVMFTRILIGAFINLIIVVGLQMFSGNSGVVSFGHISFVAIGAYASVLLIMSPEKKAYILSDLTGPIAQLSLPFVLGILVAGLCTAVVAAMVGFSLMRLSGSSATMASFALLIITHVVLINAETYTRGTRTMYGIEGYTTLWMSAFWAIAALVGALMFKGSGAGLMLRASREDLEAASAMGVNVVIVRWVAFVGSAFICGLGGALWAHFITTFSPLAMYMSMTFLTVAMLVVGGMASVSGALVGTLLISALFEGLRSVEFWLSTLRAGQTASGFTETCLGIAMIVVMVLRPLGLARGQEVDVPSRLLRRLVGRLVK